MKRGLAALLISTTALVGCGGDGGSTGAVTVTPSPSPTPSPTPAPSRTPSPTPTPSAALSATGEIKPSTSDTVVASTLAATLSGNLRQDAAVLTAQTATNRSASLDSAAGFSLSYDPSTGYRLSDGGNRASFGPAQILPPIFNPNARTPLASAASFGPDNSIDARDYLTFFRTTYQASGPQVRPQYAQIGMWQRSSGNGSPQNVRFHYFGYGPASPASSMPKSGTPAMVINTYGNAAPDDFRLIYGSATRVNIDFATGKASVQFVLLFDNAATGFGGGYAPLELSGDIVGNSVVGTLDDSQTGVANPTTGEFRMLFVGPNADEVIITYALRNTSFASAGVAVGFVPK